jgi:hypothetical protein
VASNDGFVSVGVDHDTSVFAVKSIESWWKRVGQDRYPTARELFTTADADGSNGYAITCGSSRLSGLPIRSTSYLGRWRGHPLRYQRRAESFAASSISVDEFLGASSGRRRIEVHLVIGGTQLRS